MAEISENRTTQLTRRDFISKFSLGIAAAATFATITNKITNKSSANRSVDFGQSIFTPRPGSRLKFWGRWFEKFRLR